MQATVEEISSVQKRVKVAVAADSVTNAFNQAYKKLQREAHIKGFRPGKAPIGHIKKLYGQSVAADVADQLIKEHLFSAIEAQEIKPIASPSLEDVSLPQADEEYAFSAVIDILPQVELKNYKGLKLSVETQTVAESDVTKELETIRKQHGKHKPCEPETTSASGHVLTFDQTATVGDAKVPSMCVENFKGELGVGHLIPRIEEALTGLKAGEERAFEMEVPAGAGDESIVGKTAAVVVKVSAIHEVSLPELDDEFAKDLGLESLQQLKDNISTQLNAQLEQGRRAQLENGITDQMIANHPFDVPPTMVESVIDDMLEGMPWPSEDEKRKAKQDKDFRDRMREAAERRAKNTLLLWEVAKVEKIEVTDADVDAHLEKMLQSYSPPDDKKEAFMAQMRQSMGANVKENLKFEKAVNFLIDNANIKETKPKKS